MAEEQLSLELGAGVAEPPDWRPCPFCRELERPPLDCPRCHGRGEVDMNPATAPIPF